MALREIEGDRYTPYMATADLINQKQLTVNSDVAVLPLERLRKSIGDVFTLRDGGILVDKDIHHVMISGSITYYRGYTGYDARGVIRVNKTFVAYGATAFSDWNIATIALVPTYVEVNEGDLIQLGVFRGNHDTITVHCNYTTYLTVLGF